MDQHLSLPAQTPSQFLAQLPELAEELISLSSEFEASLQARNLHERLTEGLRGWGAMEKLARDSLMERGRQAKVQAPQATPTERIEKPFVPARRLAQSIQNKTSGTLNEAFRDPKVMAALIQWTRNKNSTP